MILYPCIYKHEKTLRFDQNGGWILVSSWELGFPIRLAILQSTFSSSSGVSAKSRHVRGVGFLLREERTHARYSTVILKGLAHSRDTSPHTVLYSAKYYVQF